MSGGKHTYIYWGKNYKQKTQKISLKNLYQHVKCRDEESTEERYSSKYLVQTVLKGLKEELNILFINVLK